MKGLLSVLSVERIPKARWWHMQKYRFLKRLIYASKSGVIHTIPVGFVTNFATWIKPRGRYDVASAMHDYLYSQKAGRHYADKVFKEMMERAGCTRARIHMMYYGVRLFGWFSYYFGGK